MPKIYEDLKIKHANDSKLTNKNNNKKKGKVETQFDKDHLIVDREELAVLRDLEKVQKMR